MPKYTITDVLQLASENGCEAEVKLFLDLARSHGLALQPKKKSIMIAPTEAKTVSLLTIWPNVEAAEAAPGKKPYSMYVEVTVEVSLSGTRWDKYLEISKSMIHESLSPFYKERAPYQWGDRTYSAYYAHIDSSNAREGLDRLNNLLRRKRI